MRICTHVDFYLNIQTEHQSMKLLNLLPLKWRALLKTGASSSIIIYRSVFVIRHQPVCFLVLLHLGCEPIHRSRIMLWWFTCLMCDVILKSHTCSSHRRLIEPSSSVPGHFQCEQVHYKHKRKETFSMPSHLFCCWAWRANSLVSEAEQFVSFDFSHHKLSTLVPLTQKSFATENKWAP